MKEDEPGIILTREGRAIFLRAYEKKLRTVNRYVEGKHSYRRTLAYQARQYAQALLAKNGEMYEPIALRWQSCRGCCYFLEKANPSRVRRCSRRDGLAFALKEIFFF